MLRGRLQSDCYLGGLVRILVTGGAGFIGSNFVRRVFDGTLQGVSAVTVLDKLTYAGLPSNLENLSNLPGYDFIYGDICDSKLAKSLIDSVDAVINFAAESHVDRSIEDATDFVSTNFVGVQVLLDAVRACGNKKRFLQISTDEVYGSIRTGSWDEKSPLLPNSPYSASKAGGELFARAYNRTHNTDVLITRCSNNYGPYHFPEKLIPFFITNLLEGKSVPIYGDGKNMRDWLHVDDHCKAIIKVLLNGASGSVYNIGGGEELSNLEITHKIISAMGMDDSFIRFIEDRKGHDFRYSVNWSKIREQLNYEPQTKFDDGLRETINWYRDNTKWWKPLRSDAN
jgi:dTDP-glucose 4,6-dehydratase